MRQAVGFRRPRRLSSAEDGTLSDEVRRGVVTRSVL